MFDRRDDKKLDEIIKLLKIGNSLLEDILDNQPRFLPDALYVKWSISDGSVIDMSSGAVSLNLTQKAVGTVTELNSDGSVFTFDPSKIQAAVKDPAVLTVSVDPSTGSPTATPVAVGTTDVVVQDSATGISSPTYTFTVAQAGPTPSSLSVSWTVA